MNLMPLFTVSQETRRELKQRWYERVKLRRRNCGCDKGEKFSSFGGLLWSALTLWGATHTGDPLRSPTVIAKWFATYDIPQSLYALVLLFCLFMAASCSVQVWAYYMGPDNLRKRMAMLMCFLFGIIGVVSWVLLGAFTFGIGMDLFIAWSNGEIYLAQDRKERQCREPGTG